MASNSKRLKVSFDEIDQKCLENEDFEETSFSQVEQSPSSSQLTLSQKSEEGTPSQARKRKFNFWQSANFGKGTAEPGTSSASQTKVEIEKRTASITFRVASVSLKDTRFGKRLSVIAFNEETENELFGFRDVAELFFDKFKVNQAYEISGFNCKENQIEIFSSTDCKQVGAEGIPKLTFQFRSLDYIQELAANQQTKTCIDYIGVIVRVGDERVTRNGKPMRTVDLTDTFQKNIELKLWGYDAKHFEADLFDIIVLKKVLVHVFADEAYLNYQSGSAYLINPDTDEAKSLKEWFESAKDEAMEVD